MLEIIAKHRNESARQYAIRVLRHNILYLNLKPGQFISEVEIAEQLKMSRTPIREAFKDLEKTNIVKIEPQRGTFVCPIDYALIEDACFLRLTIEQAVVRQACEGLPEEWIGRLEENVFMSSFFISRGDVSKWFRHDGDFHRLLFDACEKRRIYEYMHDMMIHFDRLRIMNLKDINMQKAHKEHSELLDAIRQKDAEKAAGVLGQHLTFCINADPQARNLPLEA